MANVMRLRGQLDAAETLLRTAVAALDDVGPSCEFALHARMFLALTWRDQGRTEEAVAELEAIVAEQTRLRGAKTFFSI
jgi:ATP/maltotriose-dependent transcriptional regulator MalT